MSFIPLAQINISLVLASGSLPVGKLALRDKIIYFEYSPDFLQSGLNISPLHLPLKPGLRIFEQGLFDGLPGVFNDSLPDGWGRLLLDRHLRKQGILGRQLSPLDRLAYVGSLGMGALVYTPDHSITYTSSEINLDTLATQVQEVLVGEAKDVLQELLFLNGSSAGARPKAVIGLSHDSFKIIHGAQALPESYSHWLVKFATAEDGADAGAIEYVYALMAQDAGITMTKTHLFAGEKTAGYFATRRFDRDGAQRKHTHTACGLLHSDFRLPSLDYEDLLSLTSILTRDIREVERMFRLAVFNVLAHNRDDHGKNFSFLMDEAGEWKLAPAYDLTFSAGPGGEQSTTVLGEGRNPNREHLLKLGLDAKLGREDIADIFAQTSQALSRWPKLAGVHGVSRANIRLISTRLSIL
ncbi:MAG: type II toxin-antitoxin system HipA family toxin [Xanthomonadales bacterium]|nr:type II toxin-antitoxin system HipA family toxin [Xanthomonadales bacterium]